MDSNSPYSYLGDAKGAGDLRPGLFTVYRENDKGGLYVRPIGDFGTRIKQVPHDPSGTYEGGSVMTIIGFDRSYSIYLKRDLPVDLYARWSMEYAGPAGMNALGLIKQLVGRGYALPVKHTYAMCNGG